MSKYVYTTVYEAFTGIKPPEPRKHKPRRKRGCGHPYRMRLNMQGSAIDAASDSEGVRHPSSNEPVLPGSSDNKVAADASDSCMADFSGPEQEKFHRSMSDTSPPRVTYKKKRHVGHDTGL